MPGPLRVKGHDLGSQVVDCTSCLVGPLVDLEDLHVEGRVPCLCCLCLLVGLVVPHEDKLLLIVEVALRPKQLRALVQLMGSDMCNCSHILPPLVSDDVPPDACMLQLGQSLRMWPTCHGGNHTRIVAEELDGLVGLRGCLG